MQQFLPGIRSTPRAFILKDGKLLVQEKKSDAKGHYFTLPGGKQEEGETLIEALERECREEIGAEITVGGLLHVAEIYRTKSMPAGRQHQLDFIFACEVGDGYEPRMGVHPDPSQVATVWIDASKADLLRPAYVTNLFRSGDTSGALTYLGAFDD